MEYLIRGGMRLSMVKNGLPLAHFCSTALLCLATGCNHLFYFPHQKIYVTPDRAGLSYQDVDIPVDQSVTLRAWRIASAPDSKPKSRSPVALLQFHGNAENRSTHFLSVAWLAEAGADVVVFDYRGYDGSTGSPSRVGLVDDGVVMLRWFEQTFPRARRYVIGQSLGAAVATSAIARSGAHVDGLILESGFHSYRGVARMKLASSWLFWAFQWLPWIVLSGDMDPVDVAPELKIPVLAFHDRHDPVVPSESGSRLYEAFSPATTKVILNDGSRHISAFSEDRAESRREVLRFVGLSAESL